MFARPLNLLHLFMACTGRTSELSLDHAPAFVGPIARVWLLFHENRELLEYLFNVDEISQDINPWFRESSSGLSSSNRQDSDDIVVLELLKSKSESFLQAWHSIADERSIHMTADILQILTSFCIASSLFLAYIPDQVKTKAQELLENCQYLWNGICDFLKVSGPNSSLPCLEVLLPILPSSMQDYEDSRWEALHSLIVPLSDLLEGFRESQKTGQALAGDLMDIDGRVTSREDRAPADEQILSCNREFGTLITNPFSFQRSVTVQISVLRRAHSQSDEPRQPILTDYLVSLDEADLLAASKFLCDVYRVYPATEREELLHILEDVGEKCLQSYEMERCEASHGTCIRMMTGFVSSWANHRGDTLNESAMDLYNWFLEVLVKRKRASPRVYILLLELLQAVLIINSSFGTDQLLPSPRTTPKDPTTWALTAHSS